MIKWGHYWFFDVGCILSQTWWFFWFIVFLFIVFFVVPLNWDRLGSHKIDQKIAQNINFGESVFASFFA